MRCVPQPWKYPRRDQGSFDCHRSISVVALLASECYKGFNGKLVQIQELDNVAKGLGLRQ